MKKLCLILIVTLSLSHTTLCQTVDSLKVEQAGELVKIHYKILNSNQYQTFRVTVFCSINGGLESKLKSLSGDFGESVIGGRDEYMVLWDVLKDVEEVNSVDFSVRAELLKDETPKITRKNKRNPLGGGGYVLGIGEVPKIGFGGRIGYMAGWGISFMHIRGNVGESSEVINLDVPESATSIDLTKRIVNKERFKMHLYAGILFSIYPEYWSAVHNRYWKEQFKGIDLGLVCSTKMLAFSGGIGTLQNSELSAYIGLGVRF
jgi:hypothetical protein